MYKAVQIFRGGNRWCALETESLSDAVYILGGCEHAELIEVDEPVEGVKREVKLASMVFSDWTVLNPRRISMAKLEKAAKDGEKKAKAADLIGEDRPRKGGAKPVKAAAKASNGERRSRVTFADDQTIKILKSDYSPREGTSRGKVWDLIRKSKTIKDLRKARSKAGLGDNTGPVFASLIASGIVQVK
jgi:hypothetical protein